METPLAFGLAGPWEPCPLRLAVLELCKAKA